MVNILLEGYDINAPWLYPHLKRYLFPSYRVCIVAFSFRDGRVRSAGDWDALYSAESGCYYHGIVDSLSCYGIPENQIEFINYFTDDTASALEKIARSDLLYFPGGLPDRMMQRVREFGIYDAIRQYRGVVLGYSAGAVLQLKEYHLTPDEDYPEFGYYEGFPFLGDFYLEVHYEGTPEQKRSIGRVLRQRRKPVYATHFMKGAIVAENGEIRLIGEVTKFSIA